MTGRNGPAIPPCFPGHPPSPYQAPNAAGSRPFRGPADPPRSSFDPSHRLRQGVVGARSTGPLVGPSRALTRRPAKSVPVGRRSARRPLGSPASSGTAASSDNGPPPVRRDDGWASGPGGDAPDPTRVPERGALAAAGAAAPPPPPKAAGTPSRGTIAAIARVPSGLPALRGKGSPPATGRCSVTPA